MRVQSRGDQGSEYTASSILYLHLETRGKRERERVRENLIVFYRLKECTLMHVFGKVKWNNPLTIKPIPFSSTRPDPTAGINDEPYDRQA